MGMNKIFLGFRKFVYYPRYYVAINQRVIEQSASEIKKLNCIRFLKDLGKRNSIQDGPMTYLLKSKAKPKFFKDVSEGFFEGFTVTFSALQLAYFMGFAKVLIVGMDHRYEFSGNPNETSFMEGPDPNHFDSSYFQNKSWDNPDLLNSEVFYRMAREVFEGDGRKIIDCTVNGACDVFEQARLEDALR